MFASKWRLVQSLFFNSSGMSTSSQGCSTCPLAHDNMYSSLWEEEPHSSGYESNACPLYHSNYVNRECHFLFVSCDPLVTVHHTKRQCLRCPSQYLFQFSISRHERRNLLPIFWYNVMYSANISYFSKFTCVERHWCQPFSSFEINLVKIGHTPLQVLIQLKGFC